MRDHLDELAESVGGGFRLVVVAFSDNLAQLARHRAHLGLDSRCDVDVVADPNRVLYRSLGAGRGRFADVWSPGTLALYVRLIARGRRLSPAREDTRQLGADAVIDESGRLARVWLPDGPDHRPSIDEIKAALVEL